MGTGIAEDMLLKALGGAGALGVVVYLVIAGMKAFGAYLDRQQSASVEKDKTFAAALDKLGADMKSVSSEMRGAIEGVKSAMVEMDRAHTSQNNQTFQMLISLNDKQGSVISIVVQKVDHLDQAVARLADKQDDQGAKLDAITRAIPGISVTTTRRSVELTEEKPARN